MADKQNNVMVLGDYGILYERIELSMGETEGDLKALLREVVLTSAQTRRGKSCGWNPQCPLVTHVLPVALLPWGNLGKLCLPSR